MREILLQKSRGAMSVNAESRTAQVHFYTGAVVDRVNFWTGEVYKLQLSLDPKHVDLSRLNSGRAPFLDGHMAYGVRSTLGVIEKAWMSADGGYAEVRFSERDDVTPIFDDVKSGVLRNVSVGTSIGELKDITPKGEKIRTMLAVDWAPDEISLVPIGADPDAQILSAATMTPADIANHLQTLAGASSELRARMADLQARLKFMAALIAAERK